MSDVIRLKAHFPDSETVHGSEVNVVASSISSFGAGFRSERGEGDTVTYSSFGTKITTKDGHTIFVQESVQKVRSQYRKVLGLNGKDEAEAPAPEAA